MQTNFYIKYPSYYAPKKRATLTSGQIRRHRARLFRVESGEKSNMSPPMREIHFDCDTVDSHVGRLVKVRDDVNDDNWRHGVACFAHTEWVMEDYYGDGVLCKVEKPTGGYQLQWGLFERVEQARSQKRSRKKVSGTAREMQRDALPQPCNAPRLGLVRVNVFSHTEKKLKIK